MEGTDNESLVYSVLATAVSSMAPTQAAAASSSVPVEETPLECRMYEKEFPEVDECVMVRVVRITDMGAFVELLEYNNKEGIVLLSELSRKRMRTIHKHIRVGSNEVLQVLRVDQQKGYIDLSKKHLKPDDVNQCTDRYTKSKTVHSILRHVAETQHCKLIDLYKHFGWPLYKKYGHAFEAFKEAVNNESLFDEFGIEPHIKDSLLKTIQHRLGIQAVKIQASIEVTCFSYEGIDAIKPALKAGIALGTEDRPVKIQLITSPAYILFTTSMDKTQGIAHLQQAIDAITTEIKKHGGNCFVKVEPHSVST